MSFIICISSHLNFVLQVVVENLKNNSLGNRQTMKVVNL